MTRPLDACLQAGFRTPEEAARSAGGAPVRHDNNLTGTSFARTSEHSNLRHVGLDDAIDRMLAVLDPTTGKAVAIALYGAGAATDQTTAARFARHPEWVRA